MKTNPSWKDWFLFSKRDRKAFIILLIVFVSYGLIVIFYQPKSEQPVIENLDERLANLSSQNDSKNDSIHTDAVLADVTSSSSGETTNSSPHLFAFDPNILDEAGFQRLGLRDKTIHTIINYRNKGGHFYKPEDLRKIYGLKPDEAEKLLPYVKINTSKKQSFYAKQNGYDETNASQDYNKPKPHVIDINQATAEQWKTLPAIGDVLSNRIVKYRDKMGGFTSIEQVKKVYGLSDSAYQIIVPYLSLSANKAAAKVETAAASSSKKININTASANELKSNTFISSDVAEAIVIYRRQHGNYTSVEGIRKIIFINDELFQKIAPYLTVE